MNTMTAVAPHFTGLVLDEMPQLLEESFRLRYEVYCNERRFLAAEDYPEQLERDVFDRHSVHVGVVNSEGTLVATARLIEMSDADLPIFNHCTLFPEEIPLHTPTRRVVEVSRLSVSRLYNRRAGDEFYGLQSEAPRTDGPERRNNKEIALTLYKALYQASKRHGFTHWIAATEKSLQRLTAKYGFPFRAVGPESDYYGPVSPYLMELEEFDEVIASGRLPLLNDFFDGLEPEFRPAEHAALFS